VHILSGNTVHSLLQRYWLEHAYIKAFRAVWLLWPWLDQYFFSLWHCNEKAIGFLAWYLECHLVCADGNVSGAS